MKLVPVRTIRSHLVFEPEPDGHLGACGDGNAALSRRKEAPSPYRSNRGSIENRVSAARGYGDVVRKSLRGDRDVHDNPALLPTPARALRILRPLIGREPRDRPRRHQSTRGGGNA